jgi:uncharacterized protein
MKKTLNLGSVKLPAQAATKGFAFIGKRGSGKSYGAAVFAEELSDIGVPFVIFDPIDVWWGLRVAADGKGKGLPVVVFGKEHADIQLTRGMGKQIAQAVVRDNVSCVISTFGMGKSEMREIVADFSDELLRLNNTPRQVVIEEAHEFVPQRVMGATARCFAAVESLIVMGRNRGIGVTLINQRMATINKDVVSQIDTLVAFRSVGPQDRKALKDWVEAHAAEDDFNDFMKSIPSLPTGEAWVWSPEFMGIFERTKFRKRSTFHPDREKLGMTFKMPEIKQGDVQAFIEKFSKKDDSKKELIIAPRAGGKVSGFAASKVDLAKEYQRGYVEGELAGIEKGKKIATAAASKELNRLNSILIKIKNLTRDPSEVEIQWVKEASSIHKTTEKVAKIMANNFSDLEPPFKLTGGAARMLNVLVTRYPMRFTRSQLALQSNMKSSGGSYNTYLSTLRTNNLIKEEGDFVSATEEGIQLLGVSPESPKTLEELHSMWRSKLSGKTKDMFDILISKHPDGVYRDFLASAVGMEASGGSFNTYLSTMRTNGLITVEKDGLVRAHDDLFVI